MAGWFYDIDKAAVFKAKDRYDAAVEELSKLQKKNSNFWDKSSLKRLRENPMSYEKIMASLSGNTEPGEE